MQNCCNNNNNNKEKQVMLISNYCLLQLKQLYTIVIEFAFCKNKISIPAVLKLYFLRTT